MKKSRFTEEQIAYTLPEGQQGVANPQLPGHLGTADAGLAGLLNRTTLELGSELPTL